MCLLDMALKLVSPCMIFIHLFKPQTIVFDLEMPNYSFTGIIQFGFVSLRLL